ncbi:hypothetical protein N665_0017s0115 [Sinapis alba]|nr:hypothetical protein N665_0017s0115 [Sinapis alba]
MKTRRSQTPGPTNMDLINILRWRIEKDKKPSFITDMHNLYEKEPWLLQHVRHVGFDENLWFYFVTRKQRPRIKRTDSKRPSRRVAGSGRWKTTGVLSEDKDGVSVGSVKTISFKANSERVKEGITTGWVMHEFVLDKPGFQELALCRIRFYKRKDNFQYAPRLTPIVIGLGLGDGSRLVENNSQNHVTSVHHGVAAPVETHQAQGMESCSGEVVSSNLALKNQQISMAQDSNYPIFNGGMKRNPIFGHMEQYYGQGSGDRVEYQNQYLGQETTDPKRVPMMVDQALNEKHRFGGQTTYLSLMEAQQSAQAMEEKQQWNEYSGLYSSKPYVQHMIDHQKIGSSALRMSQKNEYLSQNNDLLAFREQQKHLSQDSNLPLTQQQNKILGQATHNVQCSSQPYDQYKGQSNELPTVPIKTQQQQDTFVRNSAAQKHLEAQDDVPLMDQDMEELATDPPIDSQKHQEPLGDDFFQDMDTEMADLSDDFCVGDLAEQFKKIPIPYSMFY